MIKSEITTAKESREQSLFMCDEAGVVYLIEDHNTSRDPRAISRWVGVVVYSPGHIEDIGRSTIFFSLQGLKPFTGKVIMNDKGKVSVVELEPKAPEIILPCLMIDRAKCVFLITERCLNNHLKGFAVHCKGALDFHHNLGETHMYHPSDLKPFNGSITLTQEVK